jgi:hypothetical protein
MIRRAFAAACLTLALGGCFQDPQQQLDQMQQMTDLADALNELNQRTADLQFTLDSMQLVMARQDTALRRMANVTGVQYR